MALRIDASRALRTQSQLEILIHAVLGASSDDENRAVEWKSGYKNLTDTEPSFAIGRAILGLANRPVTVANTVFEGVGYVLVGVEPGSMNGQVVPDSAELLNAIRRFTGHGWPHWDPRSVVIDGRNVLVITVEPPRDGDRIALLRKAFQPAKGTAVAEGTVFVRQPGATERASRMEIEMLQDRLLAGTATQAEASRADQRDRELRGLIADMVHSAHQWVNTMEILVIATATDKWGQREWISWANSDSGTAMGTHAQTVHQNARKIRLLSHAPQLLEAVSAAEGTLGDSAHWDAIHKGGTSGEERSAAYRQLGKVKRLFDAVEAIGISLLTTASNNDGTGLAG